MWPILTRFHKRKCNDDDDDYDDYDNYYENDNNYSPGNGNCDDQDNVKKRW